MTGEFKGIRDGPPSNAPSLVRELAVVDVSVLPMDVDRVVPHQTVVVRNGTVSAIGPSAQVHADGATVISGRGKFLMPGLADMHVHYWEASDSAMYLANSVTVVRNMRGGPFHLALQKKVKCREVPGPLLYTASPLIDGVNAEGRTTRPESIVLTEPGRAAPVVKRLASRGYQQVKGYDRLRPDVLKALGKACGEHGLRLTGHCPQGVSYEDAIAAGLSCFEHMTGIGPGESNGNGEIRRLAELAAEKDVWNCPTLVVGHAAVRNLRQGPEDRVCKYMPRPLRARWAWLLEQRAGSGNVDEQRRRWSRELDRLLEVVAMFHRVGAPLLIGTDSRNPYVLPGFSFHEELTTLVSAGMSEYAALRCATVESARFLGASEVWGSVHEGKQANLILLDADPRLDLQTLQDPHGVLVNGFYLSRRDLRGMLSEREHWARRVEADLSSNRWQRRNGEHCQAAGRLTERRYGTAFAALDYHHRRETKSRRVVEERIVYPLSGSVCEARLEFRPDLVLDHAVWTTSGTLGCERVEVTRLDLGGYQVWTRALDGGEATTRVDEPELFPDERLCVTFVALAAVSGRQGEGLLGRRLQGLTIDDGQAQVVPMTLRRVLGEADGGTDWRLQVERPGEPVEWSYRFGSHNRFVNIQEVGPLALVSWVPHDSSDSGGIRNHTEAGS